MKKFKVLKEKEKLSFVHEAKLLIFAHRDCLWSRFRAGLSKYDPAKIDIDCMDAYYAEAFGMIRSLRLLGYGYLGSNSSNAVQESRSSVPEHNLRWWLDSLVEECLIEDGFSIDRSENHSSYELTQENYQKYSSLVALNS